MLLLAIPMTILFLIAELIARFIDRRRVSEEPDYDELPDDQASPL
jgi:sec-independent protein translocase protein TatC